MGFSYTWFVYILLCADKSLYVGMTTDLCERVDQHNSGHGAVYTGTRLPVQLLWAREFGVEEEARSFENKIKKWGRMKKHMLIQGRIYAD